MICILNFLLIFLYIYTKIRIDKLYFCIDLIISYLVSIEDNITFNCLYRKYDTWVIAHLTLIPHQHNWPVMFINFSLYNINNCKEKLTYVAGISGRFENAANWHFFLPCFKLFSIIWPFKIDITNLFAKDGFTTNS